MTVFGKLLIVTSMLDMWRVQVLCGLEIGVIWRRCGPVLIIQKVRQSNAVAGGVMA